MLLAPLPARAEDCVILIHGLARTEFSFAPLQLVLESEGYFVVNAGYPSTAAEIAALADFVMPPAVEACGERRVHIVTHSMGASSRVCG